MEIVIVWDWVSFFAGILATITVSFWLIVALAFKQWKKQKEAAAKGMDSVEKLFWNR